MLSKMKGNFQEWKKIFANHLSHEKLMSKLYKELTQLNSKRKQNKTIKNPIKNGQRP